MKKDKKTKKKKEWLLRRQKKRMRQLSRQKNNHYSTKSRNVTNKRHTKLPIILTIPEHFSLLNNAIETTKFFSNVIDIISGCHIGDELFFDMQEVKIVTPDAIMYLIAVFRNLKRLSTLRIKCSGNVPYDKSTRDLIEKIGFYDYVRTKRQNIVSKDPNCIKILRGKESDGLVTSTICDFVGEKTNSEARLATKRLYPMLVELMTNVKQHAYKDNYGKMIPEWYVYVENREQDIRFIFLDSGVGIPNTIRKNWRERIMDSFGELFGSYRDADYIEAAFRGEFRTETKQGYRGKGLPEIYRAVIDEKNRLTELVVVSGCGKCHIDDADIKKEYLDNTFDGTLFMWSFKKGALSNV